MMTSWIYGQIFFGAISRLRGSRIHPPSEWKMACAILLLCLLATAFASAQSFTSLMSFDGTDGASPNGTLIQGLDGNFYGTTQGGGPTLDVCFFNFGDGCGTVYKITPSGALTTLYNFCSEANCTDGANPMASLVLGFDGNFYGTTSAGGANGVGTVFKITPGGMLTTLHSFTGADGGQPMGALMQATDGTFYGTTSTGGPGSALCPPWYYPTTCGTVFKITPEGTLTSLHNFCVGTTCTDGGSPRAELIQATDGNFYGTTYAGGANNDCGYQSCGTVFRLTPSGELTTLYSFCSIGAPYCFDGSNPSTGLVQGADGNLYGTSGPDWESVFFKLSLDGTMTTLRLMPYGGGASPAAALIQATDHEFWGTTPFLYYPGRPKLPNYGTIFRMVPTGGPFFEHRFNGSDGSGPQAGLTEATDGNFYGTTSAGGLFSCNENGGRQTGCGTFFRLSAGLHPLVSFIRASGEVGQTVRILGQGLTETVGVSFGCRHANFTVQSDTYLTATIPTDAPTDFVWVTTSGGTLKSNKVFRVTPQILSLSASSGPAGTSVAISGESLTQALFVTFGGVVSSFTVDSDTQITAAVPAGAESGRVAVLTKGGSAKSPGFFTVTP